MIRWCMRCRPPRADEALKKAYDELEVKVRKQTAELWETSGALAGALPRPEE